MSHISYIWLRNVIYIFHGGRLYTYAIICNSDVWQSRAARALLRWVDECGRLCVLLTSAVQTLYTAVWHMWYVLIPINDIKRCGISYSSFYCRLWSSAKVNNTVLSSVMYASNRSSADMTSTRDSEVMFSPCVFVCVSVCLSMFVTMFVRTI